MTAEILFQSLNTSTLEMVQGYYVIFQYEFQYDLKCRIMITTFCGHKPQGNSTYASWFDSELQMLKLNKILIRIFGTISNIVVVMSFFFAFFTQYESLSTTH